MARERNDINLDPWAPYNQIGKLIQNAVRKNSLQFTEGRLQNRENKNGVIKSTFGTEVETPFYISPSTAALCLSAAGYETLGYKATPKPIETQLQGLFGSSIHWSLLRILSPYGMQEREFRIENPPMSGRIDFLFPNPVTHDWQVIDLKCVGNYVFRLVKREGLTDDLRVDKKNYNPLPVAKRQILIYMWAASKENLNIGAGNVIYMSRDRGTIKNCLVPWGAKEKYIADEYMGKTIDASERIKENKIPEPTVESPKDCGYCGYLIYCDYGKEFAGKKVGRMPRRIPKSVREMYKLEKKEREEEMERLGISQPRLFKDEFIEDNSYIEQSIVKGILEQTGGHILARTGTGEIYNAAREAAFIPETPPEKIVVKPEDVLSGGAEIYRRGDHEIARTCDCGKNLIRSVRLIKTYISGKHRINVDESCPEHGLHYHDEITVKAEQLIND